MSFLIASGHVEVEAKTDKALSAITGIVGAMGALGPAAVVAGAGAAAAGAGVAAFGAAAGKQVAALTKAHQAHTKYQDAVEKSGRTSQDAVKAELEYQRTLAKMPRATREAAAAFDGLSDSYEKWSDGLAGDTMPVFTKSFQVFQALLPKTSGLVKGTSAELDRMMTLIAGGVASPGFDRFMDDLTEFSRGALRFMIDGVMDLSQSVAGFAQGGGFDGFMDTAREAGPLVGETLANLAKALLNLTAAGGDVGISLLTAANALAQLVNAVPPGALSAFLQLYAALKLLSVGMALVSTVAGASAMQRVGSFFAAAWAGGFGAAVSGVVQRMSALQKASVGLGVLAVVGIGISKLAEKARGAPPDVDRLTTSLKRLSETGKFTGELKQTFGDFDGLISKLKTYQVEAGKTAEAHEGVFGFRIPVLDDVASWLSDRTSDMVKGSESFSALKEDFKGLDQAMAGLVSSGNAQTAAAGFDMLSKAGRAAGMSTKDIAALMPQYKDAVASLKAEQALTAAGMGLFGQQAMATKSKLDAQKASADGLRQSIQALNEVNRAGLGGMIGFEAAIDAATKAAKDNAGALSMSHGALNLNSEKARNAATALQDLASKTDAAAASARESGSSWETVNGIYSRGRGQLIATARQMGLTQAQAEQLASQILKIPDKKSTQIKMQDEDATRDIEAFNAKIRNTPGSKSVTLKTLSAAAEQLLESFGYKVKRLPDGRVTVSASTGGALSAIGNVAGRLAGLRNKTVSVMINYRTTNSGASNFAKSIGGYAAGGRIRGLASGGEAQIYPDGGYVQGPGSSTSDSILALMGSGAMARVSNTEYVVNAASTRKYLPILEAINDGRLKAPGFAKGGKLTAKQKAAKEKAARIAKEKADAEKQRQSEGKSALKSDVTFTTGGKLAGYKNTETVHDLGMPDSVSSLVSSINTYMNNIKKAFTGKTEKNLVAKLTSSGKALLAHQRNLEANAKSLETAKAKLDDLKGKFDSLKSSISSSLIGFANITKIGKYGTSPATLIKQLTSDTTRTTQFAGQLEQLKAKGLNAQMIEDIASAGVTGGGMATAQSLLTATPDQIKQINDLQKQLTASANKAGTTAANAMYGAGIKAAEGLVAGLTAKQKQIENAMMAIAKSMEAAIKKALGIKSPSRVMMKLGEHSVDGFNLGMASKKSLITTPHKMTFVPPARAVLQAAVAPPVVINLTPTFHSMTLPSAGERRAFVKGLVREINEELRVYQRERSVTR